MARKKKKQTKVTTKKKATKVPKVLNYTILLIAFIVTVLSILVLGYYFGYNDAKPKKVQSIKHSKKLPELEHTLKKKTINKRLKEVLKKDEIKYISASHETDNITPPKAAKRTIINYSTKPKLAIIIDDVSTKKHINSIKRLHLPITMSFLPPSIARPNSAILAAKESFYMVHLPMEAMHFNAPEPLTLKVNYSQEAISKRIKKLKKLFPRVKYINNHTGSKFTANELAMNKLIYALKKNDIYFIDSRTTNKTKVAKVMKNFGYKYTARDIFLDHKNEKEYILKQIKKAIRIAKKHGTAIAIGHPHLNTLWALEQSKKYFKEVDLVLINGLNY